MRFSVTFLVLAAGVSSVAATAIQPRSSHLFPRQFDYSEIPDSCSDICYTAKDVFTACQSGTATEGCLQACRQEDADNGGAQTNYDNMVSCLTCTARSSDVTDDEILNMEQAMDQLKEVCEETQSVSISGYFSATRQISSTRSSSFAFPTGSTSVSSSSASTSASESSSGDASSASISDASSTATSSSSNALPVLSAFSLGSIGLVAALGAIGASAGAFFVI
ncbi:hypothetical protein B9479_004255 [Cryptococcus floricola]|uniref:Extracellular membrane protein CFEM domain-containing protein n=1 Tax=Cryptococcus floricola TaxID=2591691 RepID=A0A5D3AW05_9TREE|nr:hypothetical protein B9479_004255 [Cryptococcus floricola]